MGRVYRTSQGKTVDMDSLTSAHGKAIAVGNMRVNAQGDELGPGGRIVKTKAEVMRDYYALNTPIAAADDDFEAFDAKHQAASQAKVQQTQQLITPSTVATVEPTTPVDAVLTATADSTANVAPQTNGLRGGLASTVANTTPVTVNQELLKPLSKKDGIQRI